MLLNNIIFAYQNNCNNCKSRKQSGFSCHQLTALNALFTPPSTPTTECIIM